MEVFYLMLFFVLILFVVLAVYFFVYRKLEDSGQELVKFSVEQLEQKFSLNKDAAKKFFAQKNIEVTGEISRIIYNGEEYVITLGKNLDCYFAYANFPILQEGKIIKIKGIYFDNGKFQGLRKCSILV